mmetsp:Transcript_78484/g.230184  ORF Transcript_78484/g.230184 Transcript_78484/m.230184 type:complete len:306 (+) Transcript_78484:184-1101(+)
MKPMREEGRQPHPADGPCWNVLRIKDNYIRLLLAPVEEKTDNVASILGLRPRPGAEDGLPQELVRLRQPRRLRRGPLRLRVQPQEALDGAGALLLQRGAAVDVAVRLAARRPRHAGELNVASREEPLRPFACVQRDGVAPELGCWRSINVGGDPDWLLLLSRLLAQEELGRLNHVDDQFAIGLKAVGKVEAEVGVKIDVPQGRPVSWSENQLRGPCVVESNRLAYRPQAEEPLNGILHAEVHWCLAQDVEVFSDEKIVVEAKARQVVINSAGQVPPLRTKLPERDLRLRTHRIWLVLEPDKPTSV